MLVVALRHTGNKPHKSYFSSGYILVYILVYISIKIRKQYKQIELCIINIFHFIKLPNEAIIIRKIAAESRILFPENTQRNQPLELFNILIINYISI